MILHRPCERERLAAGAGAEIDHVLARLRAREKRRELGSLVLHLYHALNERGLSMDRGILGAGFERNPQPERRPARRHGIEVRKQRRRLVTVALDVVDAQIKRRAARKRRALGGALLAERTGEIRIEPFRVVASHPGRSTLEVKHGEPRLLLGAQRLRCKALAIRQSRDGIGLKLALEPQHAEQDRARAGVAHDMDAGRPPAQRVIDQAGERGAVARAGEAVGEPPVLERFGRRPVPPLYIGDDLDRGGEPGGGCHQMPRRMRRMNINHISMSTIAPTMNAVPRWRTSLWVTWT